LAASYLPPSYHAGRGRTGASDHHRSEIELMEQQDRSQHPPPGRVRVGWSGRRLLGPVVGGAEPMPTTELSCRTRQDQSRRPSSERDRAEGAGHTAGCQQPGRILRPCYHAGRGRIVADVHHRAVCESGGADDGYWSLFNKLLSAELSLCLRPSYHAGQGRTGVDGHHRNEIGTDVFQA
jgi:hypothetical protein